VFAQSQIVPDRTLGAESSQVIPNVNNLPVEVINGGAIRGANLFHSFEEFNIAQGRRAFFFSPSPTIQNILARITGRNPSQILGILGTFGNSNPNLFLINPNGLIFGPNARLSIGGSFIASTASNVVFADGTLFQATPSQPSPLLTISVPIGLQFTTTAKDIRVQGSGLAVRSGKTLGLVGGNVTLEGANLVAPRGRIEIGSVAGDNLVNLTATNQGWNLGYRGVQNFQDIQLSQGAFVDASGESGGDIQLQGRRITLTEGSQVSAITRGAIPGGSFVVTATDAVEVSGIDADGFPSSLSTQTLGSAAGGDLRITTARLILRDGAKVVTLAFGAGQGGNLAITASEFVDVSGNSSNGNSISAIAVQARDAGATGNLTISTTQLRVRDGGQIGTLTVGQGQGGTVNVTALDSIELSGTLPQDTSLPSGVFARTNGAGAAGDLTLSTRRLIVRDGAQISASTFGSGDAGNLTVQASDSVEAIGASADARLSSGLYAQVDKGATGNGGALTVDTRRLVVRDGAQISSGTIPTSKGAGGTLTVNASDSVEVIGTSAQTRSGLFTDTESDGDAGDLRIATGRLSVRDGGRVTAGTSGKGQGGTLTVIASNSVDVNGISGEDSPSLLTTRTESTGAAGDLIIETGELTIQDRAQVSVSSTGTGKAGNLQLTSGNLLLDHQGKLTAETLSGNGGDMRLQVQDLLLLRRNSQISTSAGTAQTGGDGGNITLNTPFIVAVPKENSDITANAYTGKGGNIQITSSGLFGIQFRSQLTPLSDITASSTFGIQGSVQINTSGVDPSRGLTNLPTNVVDASNQIAQTCSPSGGKVTQNEFIITGRGGLPDNPSEVLSTDAVWTDLRTPPAVNTIQSQESVTNPQTSQTPIVEANGWVINNRGQVVLTATAPTATSYSSSLTPRECHVPQTSRE
jgi:filamentous hemagglutinin family protein